MASSSGRDGRPDVLSRLHTAPAPWAPEVDVGVPPDDLITPVESAAGAASEGDRVESLWGASPPPRWLEQPSDGVDGAVHTGRESSARRGPVRRMPFVAPPAAIALIAVGVLACVVTAYTVLRGPSDDSPAAAQVAFPASAGAAAPPLSSPAQSGRRPPGTDPSAQASPGPSPTPATPADELVVSVVGLVRTPGLVRLAGTARVADAIARAGGGRPGADLLSLNMAQPVRDGDQILVGFADPAGGAGMRSAIVSASSSSPSPSGTGTAGAAPGADPAATGAPGSASPGDAAPVNLNTADEAALDTLPGVGPVTAKAIIDWRSRNGGFTSVDQLAEVDGIGPGRLAKLRDRVTV